MSTLSQDVILSKRRITAFLAGKTRNDDLVLQRGSWPQPNTGILRFAQNDIIAGTLSKNVILSEAKDRGIFRTT